MLLTESFIYFLISNALASCLSFKKSELSDSLAPSTFFGVSHGAPPCPSRHHPQFVGSSRAWASQSHTVIGPFWNLPVCPVFPSHPLPRSWTSLLPAPLEERSPPLSGTLNIAWLLLRKHCAHLSDRSSLKAVTALNQCQQVGCTPLLSLSKFHLNGHLHHYKTPLVLVLIIACLLFNHQLRFLENAQVASVI